MSADTLKSASITTLDGAASNGTTTTQLTAGVGAAGREHNHSDYVAATAAGLADTTSTYKMVRLPTSAIIKSASLYTKAALDSNGSPTLAVDLGAYYSDSTIDGTPASLQGTSISASCFVSNKTFGSGTALNIDAVSNLNANLRNSPLWKQVGLSADPGGYIDLVLAVHTGAATGVAGNIGLNVTTVN
jgi:hypothetical protein